MQLTYRGQTYTPQSTTPTQPTKTVEAARILKYRGVLYGRLV